MKFYAVEQLGPKRFKTPEGFLVCQDVPIARTGEQEYGPGETPIHPLDQPSIIRRDPEDVFRAETLASFHGKPVVNDHPQDDVTPENWRSLAIGITMNPRRGNGDEENLMLADLIITDPRAIEDIENGKREVSCGYDAEYDELAPSIGKQRDIIGNHVALVERGRCGPRCSIGDREEPLMRTIDEKRMSVWDRLRAALVKNGVTDKAVIRALDEAEEEEEKKEKKSGDAEGAGQSLHLHMPGGGPSGDNEAPPWFKEHVENTDRRFKDIEGALQKWAAEEEHESNHDDEEEHETGDERVLGGALQAEVPTGTTGDAIKKMRDSALMADSFQATIAGAEILVPGIELPKFNSALPPKKTLDCLCSLRRQALVVAGATDKEVGELVKSLNVQPITATFDQLRTAFSSAVAFKKRLNNSGTRGADSTVVKPIAGKIKTQADLNQRFDVIFGRAKKSA